MAWDRRKFHWKDIKIPAQNRDSIRQIETQFSAKNRAESGYPDPPHPVWLVRSYFAWPFRFHHQCCQNKDSYWYLHVRTRRNIRITKSYLERKTLVTYIHHRKSIATSALLFKMSMFKSYRLSVVDNLPGR